MSNIRYVIVAMLALAVFVVMAMSTPNRHVTMKIGDAVGMAGDCR